MSSSSQFPHSIDIAQTVTLLASNLLKSDISLPPASTRALRRAIECPIDYMRYAEFEAICRDLTLLDGMHVLDVGSPQWFSIFLAIRYPRTSFIYVNILEEEISPFQAIASSLGLSNLKYMREDVRSLKLGQDSFDVVLSISVIEHIFPEAGGDILALKELYRVLKPGGDLVLTVPCKTKRSVVFTDGPVYERDQSGSNFFAREYDLKQFTELAEASEFCCTSKWFICEQPGLFAVDYYEWGPGKHSIVSRISTKLRGVTERLLQRSLDKRLAFRYLHVVPSQKHRLVNLSARLHKN